MPANPVLNQNRFDAVLAGKAVNHDVVPAGRTMTVAGTLSAIGVLFALLLGAGAFGWTQVKQVVEPVYQNGKAVIDEAGNQVYQNATTIPGWLWLGLIVGLVLGLVTSFVPKAARFTAPLYALAYGLVLGAISAVYNNAYSGIVVQAIGATLGVFLVMFLLYATRLVKVTPKFMLVTIAATGGIFLLYMVAWIASIFGADIVFWNEPSALGIGFSVVIVIVASMNLMLDFNFIEQAAAARTTPSYMEWYAAFGVTVTIIWLYLEILRLLALLRQR